MKKNKEIFFWKKSNIGASRPIFYNKNELYCYYNLSRYVLREYKLSYIPSERFRLLQDNWNKIKDNLTIVYSGQKFEHDLDTEI